MESFCISGLIGEMLMLDYGMQEAKEMTYGHVNEEKSEENSVIADSLVLRAVWAAVCANGVAGQSLLPAGL